MPSQSERSKTSIAATWQHEDAFPPAEHQHLGWLAEILACESWADQDNKGWNIMHHLFHAVRSSMLAANIVADLANRWQKLSKWPRYRDQVRIAMQQTTTGEDPHGFTPLHFLCQDSDHSYRKVEASSQGTGFQPNAPSSSTGQGSYNWSTWQAYAGAGDRSSRDWPS